MSKNTHRINDEIRLLEKELRDGAAQPSLDIRGIPLSQIKVSESVFQPRDFSNGGMAYSEDHVRNLMAALSANPEGMLDPLIVWWSGKCWRVIDGHHRLMAYQRKAKQNPKSLGLIPVRVFKGSIFEATLEAARQNSKDKLPMSQAEKMNRAWKFTVLNAGSKRTIAEACQIGTASVSNMRKQLEAIKAWIPEYWEHHSLGLTWDEAKKFGQSEREVNDLWKEKLVQDWVNRLGRAFGTRLATQPEIAALALERYSERLVEALCEEWQEVFKAKLEHQEEDDNSDF
jgi:hypothetical protein